MSPAQPFDRITDEELTTLLQVGVETLALPLSKLQVAQLVTYVRLLERWNGTYNLTATRDPREMVPQHIMDCLAAAAAFIRRRGSTTSERVLDVGSGAGLPGVVIALVAPERAVVCIDSVGKKTAFLTQVAATLGLGNLSAVQCRVESLTAPPHFDVITSRAFGSLHHLVALTGRLIKASGTWMAMKGKPPEAELAQLEPMTFHVEPIDVPGLASQRCVVWIDAPSEASARL